MVVRWPLHINGFRASATNAHVQLDGNGDGIAGDNYVASFHRLFGDADGDRTVAANDFILFRTAFNNPSLAFDFDNDGNVSAADFIQFRLRFGGSI